MRFCKECQALMMKTAQADGSISFMCDCGISMPGMPDDTLMHEKIIEHAVGGLKFVQFIENSPYDAARAIVMRKCKCGLDHMTMIRIGDEQRTMYTCKCGNLERT